MAMNIAPSSLFDEDDATIATLVEILNENQEQVEAARNG